MAISGGRRMRKSRWSWISKKIVFSSLEHLANRSESTQIFSSVRRDENCSYNKGKDVAEAHTAEQVEQRIK